MADMANCADEFRRETADIAMAALGSNKSRDCMAGNAVFHSDSKEAGIIS